MSKTFEFFKELPEYPEVCKDLRNSLKLKRTINHYEYNTLDTLLYWGETCIGWEKCEELHRLMKRKFPNYYFTKSEVFEMIGKIKSKYIKVPKG